MPTGRRAPPGSFPQRPPSTSRVKLGRHAKAQAPTELHGPTAAEPTIISIALHKASPDDSNTSTQYSSERATDHSNYSLQTTSTSDRKSYRQPWRLVGADGWATRRQLAEDVLKAKGTPSLRRSNCMHDKLTTPTLCQSNCMIDEPTIPSQWRSNCMQIEPTTPTTPTLRRSSSAADVKKVAASRGLERKQTRSTGIVCLASRALSGDLDDPPKLVLRAPPDGAASQGKLSRARLAAAKGDASKMGVCGHSLVIGNVAACAAVAQLASRSGSRSLSRSGTRTLTLRLDREVLE